MGDTLSALGGLLLRAVPTCLLLIVLHFYLKYVFFKPLGKVLQQRYEATEGARKLAEESLQRASAKTAEYEAAMRAARAEIYQAQEQVHKDLEQRHAAALGEARRGAEEAASQARAQLHQDVEQAKAGLEREAEELSVRIADAILRRSAA